MALPAFARADVIYKCSAEAAPAKLSATLRFDQRGRSGSVELDFWKSYPPEGLVYSEFKAPSARDGRLIYESQADRNTGASVAFALPSDFLRQDAFLAPATLAIPRKGNARYSFRCERF